MTCCDTKQPTFPGHSFRACAPGALPGGLIRTRFFDGMVLTQADLDNEQRFWRVKRRLTNRALGEGVVWGLRLRWNARGRTFLLGPGYALDCCGNDLIVECPIEVAESDLIASADPAIVAPKIGVFGKQDRVVKHKPREACVVLQYVECPEDARPVHLDPCAPPTTRCEPSRIRETTRVLLVPPPVPEPDCLADFFAELKALEDSISDPALKDALFPPPTPRSEAPFPDPAAPLPATLRVTVPGSGDANAVTLQPPAEGSIGGASISATRVPPGGALRAGIVQFELRPHAEWGFTAGKVTEGDVSVDVVAPPVDLQQFWALEIALPDGQERVTEHFEYRVEKLGIERVFGDHTAGVADLLIRGEATVSVGSDAAIETSVKFLTVDSKSSVGEATDSSCLDRLRWGVMSDPNNGERDAKLLVLAAIYAYLADVTSRSGGAWTQQRVTAALLYTVVWRLLDVDVSAPNTEKQQQELARILSHLFQCWCDAMLYAGPRCSSEHHGVYLGCASIGPNGQILTFDMWEHRRQVLLGPLVNHWLGVFGLAPVDVVVGRLAQAICCIAGLPVPSIPGGDERESFPIELGAKRGIPIGRGKMWVSPQDSALPAKDIGRTELVRRLVGAFVAESRAPLARFRTRLGDGAIVELLAPSADATTAEKGDYLRPAVNVYFDRHEGLRPLANSAARIATVELASEIPPTSIADLAALATTLAKSLTASGMTLAGVVDAGPEGLLAISPNADPAAIDDLAANARKALDGLAAGVANGLKKVKPAAPATILRDAPARKAIASDLTKRFAKLTGAAIEAALERASTRVGIER